jgi:hypothetical protein
MSNYLSISKVTFKLHTMVKHFFEEEGNCLLELGVSLHHWLNIKR